MRGAAAGRGGKCLEPMPEDRMVQEDFLAYKMEGGGPKYGRP